MIVGYNYRNMYTFYLFHAVLVRNWFLRVGRRYNAL